MTVSELIEQLKKYPGDMRVLTLGYEGGYNDIEIKTDNIVFDFNKDWFYGPHENAKYAEQGQPYDWQSRVNIEENLNKNKGTECLIITRGK